MKNKGNFNQNIRTIKIMNYEFGEIGVNIQSKNKSTRSAYWPQAPAGLVLI